MEEQFIKLFYDKHLNIKDNADYMINDLAKLDKGIISNFEKIIDCFSFKLYILKFGEHTFIDCNENMELIKTNLPLSYQVSLSVTLNSENYYTINNATCIKTGNIEQANKEFAGIKAIIEGKSLEEILNILVFHLN